MTETPSTLKEASSNEKGEVLYTFQNKTFRLNKEKARRRFEGKRVINGIRSTEFNLLPLKYHEAYRIYKQMKANHWEPDVIDMTKDFTLGNWSKFIAKHRWFIEMGF